LYKAAIQALSLTQLPIHRVQEVNQGVRGGGGFKVMVMDREVNNCHESLQS